MANRTPTSPSTVFKSASTGIIQPVGSKRWMKDAMEQEDRDPLQAVLNRSWSKEKPSEEDGSKKRTGIATRRMLQADLVKEAADRKLDKLDNNGGTVPRSRLGASGNLFVDTGAKGTRSLPASFSGSLEDEKTPSSAMLPGRVGGGEDESSPSPHLDGRTVSRKKRGEQPAEVKRRYSFDVFKENEGPSPRLRSPPAQRRGTTKLVFKDEDGDTASATESLKDFVGRDQKEFAEQKEFVDMVHKLEPLVGQTSMRMNDMMAVIRKKFQEDKDFFNKDTNYDQLTEVSYEVSTACYFLTKWHHQLEPLKIAAPSKPTKEMDLPAKDILAQVQGAISRMEVLASKVAPVLERIVSDAKNLRRGPSGEPISPNSRNPAKLARKRGLENVEGLTKIVAHLEHLLSVTQHLAHPPTSGMPKITAVKTTATVIMAAAKFKKGLSGFMGKPKEAKAALSSAMTSLSSVVETDSPKFRSPEVPFNEAKSSEVK